MGSIGLRIGNGDHIRMEGIRPQFVYLSCIYDYAIQIFNTQLNSKLYHMDIETIFGSFHFDARVMLTSQP